METLVVKHFHIFGDGADEDRRKITEHTPVRCLESILSCNSKEKSTYTLKPQPGSAFGSAVSVNETGFSTHVSACTEAILIGIQLERFLGVF